MTVPFRTALLSTPAFAGTADAGLEFERVDDTMQAARAALEADARLRAWINHPDERVPLALLDGALAPWLARHENWSLHLYARAMRDAARDDVCWTPLLDRMAVTGIWPAAKGRVVLGGKVAVVDPLPVTQVIEPMRRWLREQTDGSAFVPLAAFQATPVRALIQSRLAVLPAVASFTGEFPSPRPETVPAEQRVKSTGVGELVAAAPDAAVATASAAAVAKLAAMPVAALPVTAAKPAGATLAVPVAMTAQPVVPATPPSAGQHVSTTQAPTAQAATTQAATAQAAIPPAAVPHAAVPQAAVPPGAVPQAAAPIPAIGPHGVANTAATDWINAQPAPDVAPVEERTYSPEQVSGLISIASQATGRTDETQVRPEIRRAINTLIDYRALPSEKLYTLYSACRLVKTWVVRIVAHVSATIELWRAALRDNNWIEVREAIVKSATARRDSVIRLILSRSGSSDVLCALCLDGDMLDVPHIARRVRTVDPRQLLQSLTVAAKTTGLRMTAMDLSPLVHHDDPDVRQQALSLLHLMVRPA